MGLLLLFSNAIYKRLSNFAESTRGLMLNYNDFQLIDCELVVVQNTFPTDFCSQVILLLLDMKFFSILSLAPSRT